MDRWDRKEVLVVSDILRAALVLLIPLAVIVNLLLAYPLIFLVTSISIFFRPARVAILPQIVEEDDLVTANSAMWIGETVADVLGYALAGLLVAASGPRCRSRSGSMRSPTSRRRSCWPSLVVRPVDATGEWRRPPRTATRSASSARCGPGFRFLRARPTLFANTLQAAVAQCTVGALLALMYAYAVQVYASSGLDWKAVYGFLETSVGAGNLVGGFVIGLIGARIAKGRLIIGGLRRLRGLDDPAGLVEPPAASRSAFGFGAGHREHGVHHPEPGAVPGADAGGPDGSRGQLPVRAGLRRDDARGRRSASLLLICPVGVGGPGDVLGRDDRRGSGRAGSCRRCATRDRIGYAGGRAALGYTGARVPTAGSMAAAQE